MNLGYIVALNLNKDHSLTEFYICTPYVMANSQNMRCCAFPLLSETRWVLAIATVGVQVSIKLTVFASRITSIGNDVSLTSGVLQQLEELMTQEATDDDDTGIFSQASLKSSAEACARIFHGIKGEMKAASKQLCMGSQATHQQ